MATDRDPRMFVKFGKPGRQQQTVLRESCVSQCTEHACPAVFLPEPPEADGLPRCHRYFRPASWWESGKTCPTVYVAPLTKEEKIKNSSKANRGGKRARREAAAAQHTAEKFAEKTNKKK